MRFVTIKELSKSLSVSPSTIRRRIKEGMPHYRFKGILLFDKNEIFKWLEQYHYNNQIKKFRLIKR